MPERETKSRAAFKSLVKVLSADWRNIGGTLIFSSEASTTSPTREKDTLFFATTTSGTADTSVESSCGLTCSLLACPHHNRKRVPWLRSPRTPNSQQYTYDEEIAERSGHLSCSLCCTAVTLHSQAVSSQHGSFQHTTQDEGVEFGLRRFQSNQDHMSRHQKQRGPDHDHSSCQLSGRKAPKWSARISFG